jgi:hypothetical protein
MPGPAGRLVLRAARALLARATAAITPNLQIARTQSRPPNSQRFDSKQNAFAAIEENRLIETIAAQPPAEQGPQG